jgi:antitoxin MazE
LSEVVVGKWGKSLAVRIPGEIAEAVGDHGGDRVEIMIEDGDIVIRRAEPRFVLERLFAGKSPEEWRAAYADAYVWGPDVGRETVEE